MTWTQVECPFEKDKKIQSYLLTAPIYSEEGEAASASSRALPLVQVTLGAGLIFIPVLHGSSAHRGEGMRVAHGQMADEGYGQEEASLQRPLESPMGVASAAGLGSFSEAPSG